jgi:hypothetical protein
LEPSKVVDDFLAVHVLFDVVIVVRSTISGSLVLVHLFGQELVDVLLQVGDFVAQVGKILRLFSRVGVLGGGRLERGREGVGGRGGRVDGCQVGGHDWEIDVW